MINYLGKMVDVIIDRPIHSIHPNHKDIIYELNYGYVPNTLSLVDFEEIDAYVLDVDVPIKKYRGLVIAVIHRKDEEDKLIVANKSYTKKQILEKTYFMEQFFTSSIELLNQ